MITDKIFSFLKKNMDLGMFFLSVIAAVVIYPKLTHYVFYITLFVLAVAGISILCKKIKLLKYAYLILPAAFVIAFYCLVSFGSFYPKMIFPSDNIRISGYTGWDYYNFMALSIKGGSVAFPVEPSEKVKALKNPNDYIELNDNLSFGKFEYLLDLSYYKGKYYLYFGLTPILTVYLPYMLVTDHALTDASVVLFFAVLSFLIAVLLFKKILDKFVKKEPGYIFQILTVMAIGLSTALCFLVSMPRVYEVAIVTGVFYTLLSFLFLFLSLGKEKNVKRSVFLVLSGLFIGLAVGCRPFYAIAVFIQIAILVDIKKIKENWKEYVIYLIPVSVCALVLMAYNYLRFDSPFEFGNKYQLTIYDVYNWKFSFENFLLCAKNYLFFEPGYKQVFPYIYSLPSQGRWHVGEAVIGLAYAAPYMIFLFSGFIFFKDKRIDFKYKKYIAGIIVIGAYIFFIMSSFGSLYRFMADFSIYFAIPSFLFMFFWIFKSRGICRALLKYAAMLLLLISVVFNCALLISNSSEHFKNNTPKIYAAMNDLL